MHECFHVAFSALYGKRLELLKEIIPKLSRVGILWNPDYSGSNDIIQSNQRRSQ